MGQRFNGNELRYLAEVLDSDFKSSVAGSMSTRFEQLFAKTFNVPYVIASTSGTAALHQALAACGVGPGDEVIVPALTVTMCAYAILFLGARPVFADSYKDTFLIDPEDIVKKISPKTKAIMAVHLYGQVCDMEAIVTIARKNNIRVIEDCAQCYLGSDSTGRVGGTIGDFGCFSLGDTKMISSGEGGVVITSDKYLAERARKFGHLGFKNVTANGAAVRKDPKIFQDPAYLRHDTFGYNYIMSELTAAVALAQTEWIQEFLGRRRHMASLYLEQIPPDCAWLIPQRIEGTPSYWTFALLYKGMEELGVSWFEFRDKFINFGGDKIRAAWALVYDEPCIKNFLENGCFFFNGNERQGIWAKQWPFDPSSPIAKYLQPRLMHFTTNQYIDAEMEQQADAFRKTIKYFNSRR